MVDLNTKLRVDGLENRSNNIVVPEQMPQVGTALVQKSYANGNGSICDIMVLTNGKPTGVNYYKTICHDSVLKPGAEVTFIRRQDGSVELSGGGGSGGGGTTTSISLTGSIVFPGGWFNGST